MFQTIIDLLSRLVFNVIQTHNLPEVILDNCMIIGRLWLVQRGNYSAVGNWLSFVDV